MRENMEKNSNSRSKDQGFQRGRRNRTAPSSSSSSSSSSSNWRSHAENEEGSSADPTTDVPTLVGTCPDMCPAKERAQRERLRDLSVFERLNGNPGKTSPCLAVKKFCRTISTNDVHASDLRPPSVLQNTLKYLLNLVESSDHPFEVVHDFVFDRTRSIRQDLSMQNVVDSRAIYMYEQMGNSLSVWFRQLPLSVLHSKEMKFCRTILRYFRMGDYKRFFSTTAAGATHLQLCLMEPLLNEVRARAISYITYCGYKLHPYPLAHLSNILMIKERELESLCYECGLEVITDNTGCKLLPAKQILSQPKSGFGSYGLTKSEQSQREGTDPACNSQRK